MATLNGFSSATTKNMAKWISGYFMNVESGGHACPWEAKTLRLATNQVDHTGSGFTELVDDPAKSPGYAYVEPTPRFWTFTQATGAAPNYDPFIYNQADFIFPTALLQWDAIQYVGYFGLAGVAVSTVPEQFIFGFKMDPILTIEPNQQLAFLIGNIKVFFQTPYHV